MSRIMLSSLICAAFGFFCQPGQAPGQDLTRRPVEMVSGAAVIIDGDSLRIGSAEVRLQAIMRLKWARNAEKLGKSRFAARRRGGGSPRSSAGRP